MYSIHYSEYRCVYVQLPRYVGYNATQAIENGREEYFEFSVCV
jgi:hypothetical protein